MSDRALATIETIAAVEEHPAADLLEIARVRGWRCVVRKADGFQTGQQVLYLEVDSHIDVTDERFEFLAKGGLKTNAAGWRGHRLKTATLRGVVSQGLILPLDGFPELDEHVKAGERDVTGLLPIRLWEPVIPFSLDIIGPFPDSVPKTDEERVQNLSQEELDAALSFPHIEVREKVDGSSVTAFVKHDGTVGVAGRNYELGPESTAYATVTASPAAAWLSEQQPGTFLQGELVGPKIQGNPLKLTKTQWLLFSLGYGSDGLIYRMDPSVQLPDRVYQDQMVPRIGAGLIARGITVDELVAYVDGMVSQVTPGVPGEGIVIRGYDEAGGLRSSLKVVSNSYLLSGKG